MRSNLTEWNGYKVLGTGDTMLVIEAERITTCKRCGDDRVTWVKSKSGKWMLLNTSYITDSGKPAVGIRAYHVCNTDIQPDPGSMWV